MINDWARKWNIPTEAIADLHNHITNVSDATDYGTDMSETRATQLIRIEASRRGGRLWRNNIGTASDANGRLIRFGLANESRAVNQSIKSSDLIGITPITVRPSHVGGTMGVFTSVEVKRPGWTFTGRGREAAQLAWLELVVSLGGIGKFSTGEKDTLV